MEVGTRIFGGEVEFLKSLVAFFPVNEEKLEVLPRKLIKVKVPEKIIKLRIKFTPNKMLQYIILGAFTGIQNNTKLILFKIIVLLARFG